MASCRALLENDSQDDLVCVVCFEPLYEGRRFNCFHLLCSHCAERHVSACLSLSVGERLAFGPVFCPQCREVTYVWPEEGRDLPLCLSIARARAECQHLLGCLGAAAEGAEADAQSAACLSTANAKLEKDIAEEMASVWQLLKEERELQENAFEWAADEGLVTNSAVFKQSDWSRPVRALKAMREEFEEEVEVLLGRRADLTRRLELLFLRKWVLGMLRGQAGSGTAVAKLWFEFDESIRASAMKEDKGKEEDDNDEEEVEEEETEETSVDLFLLSAIFRSHRPYPGAVLPEQRVNAGEITAQLLWSSGERGSEPHNFDWPIHAIFLDGEGGSGKRIAVADKGNKRVQLLDAGTGTRIGSLLSGHVIPRRVFRHKTSSNDLLLVSDELGGCMKAFEMETWSFVAKFGQGIYLCPTGVCEKSNGDLVYSDMDRGFAAVHNRDTLELEQKWTCRLLSDRYLPSPSFVAVDADDSLYVSDSQNSCVKIFNPTGGIVARFGLGFLQCPRGIAVDPLGHIFVVDSDNHRICVFDPFGKFLQELKLPDVALEYPMSLDYLPKERLLLITQCSFMRYNHSVMLFKLNYGAQDTKAIELPSGDKSMLMDRA